MSVRSSVPFPAIGAAAILALAVACPNAGFAAVTYTYTGPHYTSVEDDALPSGTFTTAMRLTGSFDLAAPLPALASMADAVVPLSYSFDTGRDIISSPDGRLGFFNFQTDANGAIVGWQITAGHPSGTAFLSSVKLPDASPPGYDFVSRVAYDVTRFLGRDEASSEDPVPVFGTWTMTTTVPEPATYALLISGLALIYVAHQNTRRT